MLEYALEISFETIELREVCTNELEAAQMLGATAAEALKHRISDIRAADSVRDVLAGNPRTGTLYNIECYFFDLSSSYCLTVVAAHATPRLNADGTVDWDRVRRVKVVSLLPENSAYELV